MTNNPLTKADRNTAQTGLYEANCALEECQRCRACGIDVSEQEARAQHLKGFFQAILDNYFAQPATPQS